MTKTEKLNKLFDAWQEDNNFVRDGIFCEDKYSREPIKILYILRETHVDDKKGKPPYDLRTDLICRPQGEGRTWNNVARWTMALINDATFGGAKKIEPSKLSQQMARIAVLNLKKSKGSSVSKMKEIAKAAENDLNNIREEIKICNPDIIIACGTLNELKKYIFTEYKKICSKKLRLGKRELAIAEIDESNFKVAEYRHPGQGCNAEKSFMDMVEIRKELLNI